MIILCIDDQPIRYRELSRAAAQAGIVVVTTCRLEDVEEYLQGPHCILGVCLDHDMPFQDGKFFAKKLGEYNYPVAVTSLNPDGAEEIVQILDEYETPYEAIPATDTEFAAKIVKFFVGNQ